MLGFLLSSLGATTITFSMTKNQTYLCDGFLVIHEKVIVAPRRLFPGRRGQLVYT